MLPAPHIVVALAGAKANRADSGLNEPPVLFHRWRLPALQWHFQLAQHRRSLHTFCRQSQPAPGQYCAGW